MEIRTILKKRREELGLTYEELGKLVGVGKSTVRKWEVGAIENMRRDNIVALSKALNLSPAILMGWEVDINENKHALSKEETKLLSNYNSLNSLGKEKLIEYSNDLIETPKYFSYEEPLTIAAHSDGLTEDEKFIMDKKIEEFEKRSR